MNKAREFDHRVLAELQALLGERVTVSAGIREHHGKVEAVAKALGISRKGLYLKRQRLGL